MKKYLIPFLFYIFSEPLLELITNRVIAYTVRTIGTGLLVLYFYKGYKLRFKLSNYAIIAGLLISVLWFLLDPLYTHLGGSGFEPVSTFALVIKILGFLLIAPVIEELFVRDFLLRFFTARNWKKVKIGTFSWPSFIITVLFFGLSHNQWLSGLIAGLILNLLLYKTKRIDSCIQAHFVANLALVIFILFTGQWGLW